MSKLPVPDLGGYLREQRQSARLSLRQLSDVAGVSNPYLSQIERGLKKPSAEILGQLAKGLRISAESLYVRAGILEERAEAETGGQPDVPAAILADPRLTDRQRRVLLDVYGSLVGDDDPEPAHESSTAQATTARKRPTSSTTTKAGTTAKAGTAGRATKATKATKAGTTTTTTKAGTTTKGTKTSKPGTSGGAARGSRATTPHTSEPS